MCFNWATHSRAWKLEITRRTVGNQRQLQLGHALSRVETTLEQGDTPQVHWLQLGHALSRVETGSGPAP